MGQGESWGRGSFAEVIEANYGAGREMTLTLEYQQDP